MEGGEEDIFVWTEDRKKDHNCPDFKRFHISPDTCNLYRVDVITAERYCWYLPVYLSFFLAPWCQKNKSTAGNVGM